MKYPHVLFWQAVRPCARASVTKCTIMYCQQMAGRRNVNFFHIRACWQSKFAFQFLSKSSAFFTFMFKVKDSNRVHWQGDTWLFRERLRIEQTLPLQTNRKSHIALRLSYFHLILMNFSEFYLRGNLRLRKNDIYTYTHTHNPRTHTNT